MDKLHSHQTGAKPWAWSFVIDKQSLPVPWYFATLSIIDTYNFAKFQLK